MSRSIIFTTCGTSILTNIAKEMNIPMNFLYEYSNKKESDKNTIGTEARESIEKIIHKAFERILESNISIHDIRKLSAEMNGLFEFFQENGQNDSRNMHYLIHTDTWLGKESALILKNWMQEVMDMNVDTISATNLQTSNSYEFQAACSDLAYEIWQRIDLKDRSQDVYFNLTGGFKAIQAFLQSIAQLIGAESFYIFETSNKIINFPKLPIKIDFFDVFKNHLKLFRKLSINRKLENKIQLTQAETENEIREIPDTLYFYYENMFDLSAWGLLCWEEEKERLYSEKVLEPPTPLIEFGKKFESSVKDLEKDRIRKINEAIDRFTMYLHDKKPLDSITIKPLSKKYGKAEYEVYAWSDKDARRLYGYYKGNNTFVIEYLGKHL